MWRTAMIFGACVLAAGALADERLSRLGKNYAADSAIGRELVGTRPPDWAVRDWMNSEPLTLAELHGKVVLVRWWTAPDCPYCAASAEALNDWAEKYREAGLVVIGMYHHKARTPLTNEHVRTEAKKLGFSFPIATDPDWRTLRRWWLDRSSRGWTSVTFLLGRDGVIRHVHAGGAYFKGEPGYAALDAAIRKALAEK